jgi:hypothetical protein
MHEVSVQVHHALHCLALLSNPFAPAITCCWQTQGDCSACVGFAVTAAAGAAINVYKQQSWDKLGLSEQDLSFCKFGS